MNLLFVEWIPIVQIIVTNVYIKICFTEAKLLLFPQYLIVSKELKL